MKAKRVKELQIIAQELRIIGLEMVQSAQSGHIGGAFSLSEIMAVLYFEKMNLNPDVPDWNDRDRFVMSKGHGTVALYPTLSLRGFIPRADLQHFRKIDGYLSGHVEMTKIQGVDMSTGSLGQGYSTALGIAVAAKQLKKSFYTYAVLGDGELQEGQVWEAAMYTGVHGLDNLVTIVDYNNVQLDGTVPEILDLSDLAAKFEAFNYHVISIDGHSVEEISDAVDEAKSLKGKATVILANTIKGKGISYMEGKSQWHGKTPNKEEFETAFKELRTKKAELEVQS